jgi:UDP-2-acetamido-3-amino-2,3-dideoxy-glucuronate N-acetyltransferase
LKKFIKIRLNAMKMRLVRTGGDMTSIRRSGKKNFYVHSKALVDRGAVIGKGTRVWAFAQVMAGAKVGSNCNICGMTFIESGAEVGNNVTIKNGVQVWEGVTIEDGVFLGPNCTLTNHLEPRAFIKAPKERWLKRTLLKEGCTIGANATIICGATVGRYAFIAAGAVVTRSVPDHALVMGNPARRSAWVCRCGEKLAFSGRRATCRKCGDKYVKTAGGASVRRADAG